jgi:outer membrane receptor protein involved in Fe transport
VAQDAAAPAAAADQGAPASAAPGGGTLQEVVVTAERRQQDIQTVPIDVTATSQAQLDVEGAKDFTDIVKYTPGLNVTSGQGGGNSVIIRGISSSTGVSTTGIYIDDVPIQIRNVLYNAGTAFPGLFDLQRVEILHGPQGTLFGAGSEGGTVRFILTQPNLNRYETYARAEGNHIDHGGLGYEGGVSFDGPIAEGRLGFLASAYYRKTAGYINAVTGTYSIVNRKGALLGNSVDFTQQGEPYPDANWDTTKAYRLGLLFKPTDSVTIYPSFFYQDRYFNHSDNAFFAAASNPSSGAFNYYASYAGDPSVYPYLLPQYGPNLEQADDRFSLYSLNVTWNLGPASVIYDGSYFDRTQFGWRDYTELYNFLYGPPVQLPGYHSNGYLPNDQQNFVQELRATSNGTGRVDWTVGAFYSHNRQQSADIIGTNFLAGVSPFTLGFGTPGLANGPPFGPGSNGFENYFGYPLQQPGSISFIDISNTVDSQLAFYGQANIHLTKDLTLAVGDRESRYSLNIYATNAGGENNVNFTFGESCSALGVTPPCIPGVNPPGEFAVTTASASGWANTPSVNLQYQYTPRDMIYATVSKGYRPAGGELLVPVDACGPDLDTVGLLSASGTSEQPAIFQPDSLWNYEVGSKDTTLNGKMVIDSSIYFMRWSNIQTSIGLPCAYNIQVNAGHAISKGLDLQVQLAPTMHLTLAGTFSYNKSYFDESTVLGKKQVFAKDTGVPGAGSPLTYSAQANYTIPFGQTSDSMYVHADWSYRSRPYATGSENPQNSNFIALSVTDPAYQQTNLRIGALLGGNLDVSVYANNLFDAHPLLNYRYSNARYYWLGSTIQPRTEGLTVTYRR